MRLIKTVFSRLFRLVPPIPVGLGDTHERARTPAMASPKLSREALALAPRAAIHLGSFPPARGGHTAAPGSGSAPRSPDAREAEEGA